MSMRVSPRRSVLASLAAGASLAAAVVAGGYAASGTMPFSQWPDAILASADEPQAVALAPASHEQAPVLTLPVTSRESRARTQVIALDEAAGTPSDEPGGEAPTRTRARSLPETESREPRTAGDDLPDTSPTTAPQPTTKPEAPAATAAPAEAPPSQPAATTASTRRVTLTSPTAKFASAKESSSGQPELTMQMAVADAASTTGATTVALSLKLAPTDVQALVRTAQAVTASNIALEAEVDVVDATIATAGEPACAEGTCLRVQMKFAADARPETADEPQVEVLDDGTALSNRVKVVVQIDPEDLGGMKPTGPSDPAAEPAPEAGAPTVLSLPLLAKEGASEPATDTATVTVPETDPKPGTPAAPTVQVQAQLEVVEEPAAAEQPPVPATPAPEATGTQGDCPPEQGE
jgi:hypothetical protein